MSTRALIGMLIICAAMLTIQLFGYFALQPSPGREGGARIAGYRGLHLFQEWPPRNCEKASTVIQVMAVARKTQRALKLINP